MAIPDPSTGVPTWQILPQGESLPAGPFPADSYLLKADSNEFYRWNAITEAWELQGQMAP